MENFTFEGCPLAVGSTRNGRTKFFLVTGSDNQFVRCIFNGFNYATETIEKCEESCMKIKVIGKIKSAITTRTGRKYNVFYPSRIHYGEDFVKQLNER